MEPTPEETKPEHHESIIERVGDELEARFLAAAEVATGTTSAETNLANAALRAIEGPEKADPAAEPANDGSTATGGSDPVNRPEKSQPAG